MRHTPLVVNIENYVYDDRGAQLPIRKTVY
jgi:hypothetical protein